MHERVDIRARTSKLMCFGVSSKQLRVIAGLGEYLLFARSRLFRVEKIKDPIKGETTFILNK